MLPVKNVVSPTLQDPEHRRTSATSAAEPDSPTLVKLLEQYLISLESGRPLSRRALLALHPELADQLSLRLDALDFMFNVAPQLADRDESGVATSSADSRSRCLGDFRLLHEIGRGGMGVVYEAEQISLGRRVALKVLPFAAMLSRNRLRRFLNEARVAASLDHPHIVPIHAVGVERGVHYYAMRLIHGQSGDRFVAELQNLIRATRIHGDTALQDSKVGSLAVDRLGPPSEMLTEPGVADDVRATCRPSDDDVLSCATEHPKCSATTVAGQLGVSTPKDLHTPGFFQMMARFGSQAAEALHFAHENGVLHRDIKPANLLLDADGHLWVTDFGLAHLRADAGMTLSGELMGTLRYMSPEQAQGDRHVLDPRSDVYSLGATLYEFVTRRPVFDAHDHAVLLRQIAEQEPRRPRTIEPNIPSDLETILLKALQKRPEDRYASAQALADDLHRFLEQKPIQAKPPSPAVRLVRWSRRNHAQLLAATAVLFVCLILLSACTVLIVRSYRQQVALREAAETAIIQRDDALETAVKAIDEMYFEVAEKLFVALPAQESLRREFLTKAHDAYEKILPQRPHDPAVRFSAAKATLALALIEHDEVSATLRDTWLTTCISELNGLVTQFPDVEDYCRELAMAYRWAAYFRSAQNGDTCESLLVSGLHVAEDNVQRHPQSSGARSELLLMQYSLANNYYLRSGRLADAMRVCADASMLCQQPLPSSSDQELQTYARWIKGTALTLQYARDRSVASQLLALRTAIAADFADSVASTERMPPKRALDYIHSRAGLVDELYAVAVLQLSNGDAEAAMATANRALAVITPIVRDHGQEPRFQVWHAKVLWIRGQVLWRTGRLHEARAEMAEAIRVAMTVTASHLTEDLTTILIACPFEDLASPNQASRLLMDQLSAWRRPDHCIASVLVEYRLGNYAKALQQIEEWQHVVFEVEDPALCFLRAACLRRLNRADEAAIEFQKAVEAYQARPTFMDYFDITCHEMVQLFNGDGLRADGRAPVSSHPTCSGLR